MECGRLKIFSAKYPISDLLYFAGIKEENRWKGSS
jgi:hypothetical protein